jgi:hypothetical protein
MPLMADIRLQTGRPLPTLGSPFGLIHQRLNTPELVEL